MIKDLHPKNIGLLADPILRDLVLSNALPIYFIRKYCHIVHPTYSDIPFDLSFAQETLINAWHDNMHVMSYMDRQSGKSTCAAAYLLWYAMFNPEKYVAIMGIDRNNAKLILELIRYMHESLPPYLKPTLTVNNKQCLFFENGSQIHAVTSSANSCKGRALSLIYFDDLAYIRESVATNIWQAMSYMAFSPSRIIINSSPNHQNIFMQDLWNNYNNFLKLDLSNGN